MVAGHALDVALVGERHHHVLGGDQRLDVEVGGGVPGDGGATLVAELLLELGEVGLDQLQHLARVGQDVLEVGDPLDHLLVLGLDLAGLEPGQAAQAHVDDGLGLALGELQLLLQLALGGASSLAARMILITLSRLASAMV